jgi:predicted dipeptidase
MLATLDRHLEEQRTPLKRALIELVRIPSVCDEGGGGYPFGEAIDRALREALAIAGELGFRATYGDGGYYGYAEVGEGPEILGILGHLDVVPAGNLEDWATHPFAPVEHDGMLYGRGTQDDKGPLLAALFAVRALMDAGVTFSKRVRFIFGTDEESLWRGIKRYKEIEELPVMGFTPDSRFPLVYAEKGLLQCVLQGKNESGLRVTGGSAFNAVPDSATYFGAYQGDLAEELSSRGFEFARNNEVLIVMGQAAHAMEPENGINAITRLCLVLDALGTESRAVQFIAHEVAEDPYARRIFGPCADKPSGQLKFNVGKIDVGDVEQIYIDCRIPVTVSKEKVVAKLSTAASRYGLAYREFDWLAPIYLPLDHFMIKTLMRVYSQISGDLVSVPVVSGGATYARAIDNCVAFGALLPNEQLTEHQPNERVVLKNLYKAMEIYAQAIYELTR